MTPAQVPEPEGGVLDKLVKMGQVAKTWLLYILGPLIAIVYFISSAMAKKDTQIDALKREVANNQVQDTLKQKEEAANDANAKEQSYRDLLAKYKRGDGGGSKPGV